MLPSTPLSRRSLLRSSAAAATLVTLGGGLAACGGGSSTKKVGTTLSDIAGLAKKEGKVQLIAYPSDWANYGGSFKAFEAKYGVKVHVANPNGSSAQELQAVKQLMGQSSEPDVVDIGYTFVQPAMQQKLLQQYKPSNWSTIPDNLKDPDGWWVGAYYGVISIGVNTAKAPTPKKLTDLLNPEYKGKVAMIPDPRGSANALAAVMAASIANGGTLDDVTPGIEFFAKLVKSGNTVNVSSTSAGLGSGQSVVAIDWNYNFLTLAKNLKKQNIDLTFVVPDDAVIGNYYAQPLTAKCPQPNAGRLWVDWLTSDGGAEQYALGGAIPARIQDLTKNGKLSKEALASIPPSGVLSKIVFPSIQQGEAAAKLVTSTWSSKVASS